MSNSQCAAQLTWLTERCKLIEARSLLTGKLGCAGPSSNVPKSLWTKLADVDVNEVFEPTGESLIVAAVRYLENDSQMAKLVILLLREGADVNAQDKREKRTALMYAIINDKLSAGRILLNAKKLNLKVQDRLGNTALIYAAIYGRDDFMSLMLDILTRSEWVLPVLQIKNCMGYTAEELAIRNRKHRWKPRARRRSTEDSDFHDRTRSCVGVRPPRRKKSL